MKPSQIFDLIVRVSGYFALFFAGAMLMNMILTGVNFSFRQFLLIAANGVVGFVLMKMAPVITEMTYGSEQ